MDSAKSHIPTTPAIFKGRPPRIPWIKKIPWETILGATIGTVLGQVVTYVWLGSFYPGVAIGGIVGQSIWSYFVRKRELEDEQRKSI